MKMHEALHLGLQGGLALPPWISGFRLRCLDGLGSITGACILTKGVKGLVAFGFRCEANILLRMVC